MLCRPLLSVIWVPGGEGVHVKVSVVLRAWAATGQGEGAAYSKARGTGSWRSASLGSALLRGVTCAIETIVASANIIGELDHTEHVQGWIHLVKTAFKRLWNVTFLSSIICVDPTHQSPETQDYSDPPTCLHDCLKSSEVANILVTTMWGCLHSGETITVSIRPRILTTRPNPSQLRSIGTSRQNNFSDNNHQRMFKKLSWIEW